MKRVAAVVVIAGSAICAGPHLHAQSTPTSVRALWIVSEGIATPESVYVEPRSGSIFVSDINGQPGDRDGNGYISRLAADGTVTAVKWATGFNAPKGLRSFNDTLWVTDLDEVIAIDIPSARITSRLKIDGARFLNDLTVGPEGTIYVSDSQGNRIYEIRNGRASVFAEGATVEVPNGLLVDGGRLIVASIAQAAGENAAPGRLFALDLKTKAKTVLSTMPIGRLDGLESDGQGGFIVSDVGTGRILQVTGGDVRVLRELGGSTADIAYIPARRIVIVPHLRDNKVAAYDVSDAVK